MQEAHADGQNRECRDDSCGNPVAQPKKPKIISPAITPTSITARASATTAAAPVSVIQPKRTGKNTASADRTEMVKALFVTRL